MPCLIQSDSFFQQKTRSIFYLSANMTIIFYEYFTLYLCRPILGYLSKDLVGLWLKLVQSVESSFFFRESELQS